MVRAFAILLIVHGAIHLLGFAKAFHFAELPQLTQPISPKLGLLWLASSLLFIATVVCLYAWQRWWWAVGAVAICVSTIAISQSWTDARAGAIANLVVLVGVVFGFLAQGPFSLRAAYERDVEDGLARPGATRPISDADLARLPPPVQRYLRKAGVVGQPRVGHLRARMHGRIRGGPDARWMPFDAEQHDFFDGEPARLFYMTASMFNAAGELTNFWSNDRRKSSLGGTSIPAQWSTPIGDYRLFGPFRLASRGEGQWREAEQEYAYIELEFDEITYNMAGAGVPR